MNRYQFVVIVSHSVHFLIFFNSSNVFFNSFSERFMHEASTQIELRFAVVSKTNIRRRI